MRKCLRGPASGFGRSCNENRRAVSKGPRTVKNRGAALKAWERCFKDPKEYVHSSHHPGSSWE